MEPTRELAFTGSNDAVLYACGDCGSIHSPAIYACNKDLAHSTARKAADNCCAQNVCDCGAEIDKVWTACHTCRERRKLQRAQIVTDYDGPVFSDHCDGDWGEGYSSDMAGLIESLDLRDDAPAYCWPCNSEPLQINFESVIDNACDDQHEDARNQIVGLDALELAVEQFNAAQTCTSYYPDHTRVIVINPRNFDAMIAARNEGAKP